MGTLLIIDGHALIHRAYHSVPKNLTHNGTVVNAVYGFYSTLFSALDTIKPRYLAICMDPPGPVFRNAEFVGYRAQRKPSDLDLVKQFPIIKQSLEDANLTVFSVGGYEADDCIGTLAKRALKKVTLNKRKLVSKVVIMTGDRDLMQLVNEKTQLLMPGRALSEMVVTHFPEVKERLGVLPSQVVDLKALTGDSSDNYPGVPGIGPKTALELLEKYQSLDNLYAHLDELPEKLKTKLSENRGNAYLSQKLAQLVFDVPLNFHLKHLRVTKKTYKQLAPVLESLGFRSLVSRLARQGQINVPKEKPKDTDLLQPSLF